MGKHKTFTGGTNTFDAMAPVDAVNAGYTTYL
jgi:hypothetical protein